MARKKALEEEQLTDTNYYILLTLIQPVHGYKIMQMVKEISENTFEIGPASLYTSLRKMTDAGLILLQGDSMDDKKVYEISEYGMQFLVKDYERRKKMVEYGKSRLEVMNNGRNEIHD